MKLFLPRWFFVLLLVVSVICVEEVIGEERLGRKPFGEELVDRIVAVVNDDPIFLSDIERVIRLGLVQAESAEGVEDLYRRVLDELIEQRLRLHEVERFVAENVNVQEVDRQLMLIRNQLGWGTDDAADLTAFQALLAELGLDEAGLRHLLTRQLRVLAYINERLRARVFVDQEDISAYYETEFKAEMERLGSERPPLEEIRQPIRTLLEERRLNSEIEAWTRELRLAADIVDHFGDPVKPLPPVVLLLEEKE